MSNTTTAQFLAATDGSRATLDQAVTDGIITPAEWFGIAADLRDLALRSDRLWAALSTD